MKKTELYFLLLFCASTLLGCGKKAVENKPLSEVKNEAEKMDINQLKAMAAKYQDAIVAKKTDIEKVAAKIKDIPPAQMLSDQAKNLKADLDNLNKSVSALKDRFDIYYSKLKEKGGQLPDLKI